MTGILGDAEKPSRFKPWLAQLRPMEKMRHCAAVLVPPLITIGLLLLLWQVLCSGPGASLPPPSKVVKDTWELIRDPFCDNGGTDVGLFWQILASLKRVGIGFSLAAVCGIALGVLIGQSSFAYRGLDPIFQVLRTVPPLAWLPISLAALHEAQPSALQQVATAGGGASAVDVAAAQAAGPGSGGGGNGAGAAEVVETVVKDEHDKIGRNDPCWCGSGKKYKKCHGA